MRRGIGIHDLLTEKCAGQEVGAHGLIALDWHNGNRSVLADANLSGMILGQTLTTTPEDQYRALLESTAFGARTIIESFRDSGVDIDELVVAGGLTKNTFLMQLFCDICRVPLSVGTAQQMSKQPLLPWERRRMASTRSTRREPFNMTPCTPNTLVFTTTSAAAETRSCTGSRRSDAKHVCGPGRSREGDEGRHPCTSVTSTPPQVHDDGVANRIPSEDLNPHPSP